MAGFQEALKTGVLVFDGPMGTEIYRHHVFTNRSFDELSLAEPKLIRQIHAEYRDAGADVLTTNTFGANRVALGQFGLADRLREIVLAGAKLAREVADGAGRPVFVAGSVGPLPLQPQYEAQLDAMVAEQVEPLLAGGADFILFETQPTRVALERCAAAMRPFGDVPFILSCTVVDGAESANGEPVSRLLAPLEGLPQPVAWGLNCGNGPSGLLTAVEQAMRITQLPLVVQPNAGMPREVEHRMIYLCSPEYLATYGRRYISLGVSAVGGCCGITPAHIAELAKAIRPLRKTAVKPVAQASDSVPARPAMPMAERSRFAWRLANRKWVTSVELLPPRGYDLADIIEKSKTLYRQGVDCINIPDGPRASSRISPLITADRIQRQAGIEVILHFCCRDRNLIGMQADLLACAACGIHNILFVTGDPPKLGNYPNATGVFDTDSIGMAAVQKRLNEGVDLGGQEISPATRAVIGVGLDPTALDLARELDRFRQKVDAGAEYAITQPVFDPEALLRILDQVEGFGVPILAGIWPLASYRNALFLKHEVPGVEIPASVLARMESAADREGQLAMGVEIARESIERVRTRIAGIQVSAPFGKLPTALAVLEGWGE